MNMHTKIDDGVIDQIVMAKCAYDLLLVAIAMIDETNVPAEVGAHADLATHQLGKWLCDPPRSARLKSNPVWPLEPRAE